jgi:FkbM family methyltransferase
VTVTFSSRVTKALRNRVPYDSSVRRRWRAAKYWHLRRRLAAPRLLTAFSKRYPDAYFIEIGSNDGEQSDQLSPFIKSHRWKGLMIEPVPYLYERLKRNYGDLEGVGLVNLAIADHDGTTPFYYVIEADPMSDALPEWYEGIGSFDRQAVLRHGREIPDIEDRVVEAEVPCVTFETLCGRHRIERIDLILVDTEGYDAEIVAQIDLDRRRPRLLVYEHYHLTPEERLRCREMVEAAGYETMEEGFDTFCFDASPSDPLTRAWRKLTPAVPGVSIHDPAPRQA